MKNEKRLIDYGEIRKLFDEEYKKIVELICSGETHLNALAVGFTAADRVILRLPVADVVEVVRCKDCPRLIKEIVEEETPYGFSNKHDVFGCGRILELTGEWVDVFLDDFCSYGERKEVTP